MKISVKTLGMATLALTLGACASWWTPDGPTLLQGQVRLNGAAPGELVAVEVRLIDRSAPHIPITLAEQTLVRPHTLPLTFSLPVIGIRQLPADGVYVLEARLYDSQGEHARNQDEVRWRPGDTRPLELTLIPKTR